MASLQIALGRTDSGFYWTIIRIIATSIAIFIGTQYSIEGIALSLLILNFVVNPLFWRITIKPLIGGKYIEYFRITLLLCIVIMISALPLYALFHNMTMVLVCLIVGLFYIIAYLFILFKFFPHTYIIKLFAKRINPWLNGYISK